MIQEQNPLETQQQPETAPDESLTTLGQEPGAELFNASGTSELEPPTLTVESVVLTAENAALRQEIEGLQGQLTEQSRQFDDLKTRHLSLAAEFDNFRKRTTREKEELQEQIKGQTLEELLPAIDNFERARNQIKPANEGEMGIHKSYQGVYKILVDSLKRLGVYPMRPEGEPFDPKYHEAMLQEPTNEHPEGTVIEQLVRGYMLGERVLRHALVKVAAAKEETIPPSEAEVNPPEIDKEEAN